MTSNESDDDPEDVLVLTQDYLAAHQYVQTLTGLTDAERDAYTELYAARHAALGPWDFRLSLGLEKPRHSWEQATAEHWKNPLPEADFRKRHEAALKEPPTEALLQALRDDMERCVVHYSQLIPAAQRVLDQYHNDGRTRSAMHEVTYHVRECNRPFSLLKEQVIALGEWALECRVRRGLSDVGMDPFRSPTAIGFCNSVTRQVFHIWQEWLKVEESAGSHVVWINMAARRFLRGYSSKLPPARFLQTEILREVTLLKLDLRESGPPSTWMSGHNSGVVAPTVSFATDPEIADTDSTGSKTPVLQNWAFGYDAVQKQWWLFHRKQQRWLPRKTVSIPGGFQSKAMMLFAENDGRVRRSELLALVSLKIASAADSLDQGISRLRKTLLNAIPGFTSDAGESKLDPLPLRPNGEYIAAVDIGWARPGDDASGNMEFHLQSEL